MTIRTIMSDVVATASPQEAIRTAASRMAANDLGSLVVIQPGNGGVPIGILTDRDIVTRCVAAGVDPDAGLVLSVMSQPVHCITEHAPIDEALNRMAKVGTRRLVVVSDAGTLVGMLSLDDVLFELTEQAGAIGALLAKQQPMVTA